MKEGAFINEIELLLRLQQNDEQALGSLMRYYYKDLYSYASRFTDDHGLIKDCIQEVFISLWQRRENASKVLSPRYYFLRATKNKVLKAIYKNKNASLAVLNNDADSFYEFSIEQVIIEKQANEERVKRVRGVLSQLSKKQREIVYLKYYQFLDHGQIAELMNLNQQSVYNLLHETIRKLKKLIKDEFFTQ